MSLVKGILLHFSFQMINTCPLLLYQTTIFDSKTWFSQRLIEIKCYVAISRNTNFYTFLQKINRQKYFKLTSKNGKELPENVAIGTDVSRFPAKFNSTRFVNPLKAV